MLYRNRITTFDKSALSGPCRDQTELPDTAVGTLSAAQTGNQRRPSLEISDSLLIHPSLQTPPTQPPSDRSSNFIFLPHHVLFQPPVSVTAHANRANRGTFSCCGYARMTVKAQWELEEKEKKNNAEANGVLTFISVVSGKRSKTEKKAMCDNTVIQSFRI